MSYGELHLLSDSSAARSARMAFIGVRYGGWMLHSEAR